MPVPRRSLAISGAVLALLTLAGAAAVFWAGRTPPPGQTTGRDPVRQSLIEALRRRESLTRALACRFTIETTLSDEERARRLADPKLLRHPPEEGPIVEKYRWATDGVRWRCDRWPMWSGTPERPDGPTQRAFDGETYYQRGMTFGGASASKESPNSEFMDSLLYLFLRESGRPLSEAVADGGLATTGDEEINGERCYRLTRSRDDPARGRATHTYWLATDGSAAVRRYEYEALYPDRRSSRPEIGAQWVWTVDETIEPADGVILPRVVRREMHFLEEGSQRRWVHTARFVLDEVEVDPHLSDDLFVLNVPK